MPLHILHIIPHASRMGGYERQGLLIARLQHQAGDSVAIATHQDDASRLDDRFRQPVPEEFQDASPSPPSPIQHYGIPKRFGRFSVRHIKRALQFAKADIVHIHAIDGLSAAFALQARTMGIPAVCKIATQGDITQFGNPPVERLPARQRRQMIRTWGILKSCEMFIAINGVILEELKEHGIPASRIKAWPNLVAFPETPSPFDPEGTRAIVVGRLVERKRLDVAIDALAIVRKTCPKATLQIVGEGPDCNHLKEIPTLGLTWISQVEHPQPYLDQADLFIFPSEHEGCPNALLEAAAHGLPCIASDIPGVVEWCTSASATLITLTQPGDVQAVADAWINLLQSPESRRRQGQALRDHIYQQASPQVMLPRYQEVYSKLLQP